MKPKTIYISLAVTLVVIALITYFVGWRMRGRNKYVPFIEGSEQQTDTNTLGLGSNGEEVKRLQRHLNTKINLAILNTPKVLINSAEILAKIPKMLNVDGSFGAKTLAALQYFYGKNTITISEF